MPIPRPLVTGPQAWIGAELAKRPAEWTYTLSADEIGEIQTNVAHLRGRDTASVTNASSSAISQIGRRGEWEVWDVWDVWDVWGGA